MKLKNKQLLFVQYIGLGLSNMVEINITISITIILFLIKLNTF